MTSTASATLHEVHEPKTEEPLTEDQKAEEPPSKKPKMEEPLSEEPKTEEPPAKKPKMEETLSEEPKTEEPLSEELKTEEPLSEEPPSKKPKMEETLFASASSGNDEGAHVDSPADVSSEIPVVNGAQHTPAPTLPEAEEAANAMGPYVCPDCQRDFSSRKSLAEHARHPHTQACQECPFKTTNAARLNQHKRAHRPETQRCDKCGFKGSTRKELRRHKWDAHGPDGPLRGKIVKKPWTARAQTAHAGPTKNGALRGNGLGRRFGGPSPRS